MSLPILPGLADIADLADKRAEDPCCHLVVRVASSLPTNAVDTPAVHAIEALHDLIGDQVIQFIIRRTASLEQESHHAQLENKHLGK